MKIKRTKNSLCRTNTLYSTDLLFEITVVFEVSWHLKLNSLCQKPGRDLKFEVWGVGPNHGIRIINEISIHQNRGLSSKSCMIDTLKPV